MSGTWTATSTSTTSWGSRRSRSATRIPPSPRPSRGSSSAGSIFSLPHPLEVEVSERLCEHHPLRRDGAVRQDGIGGRRGGGARRARGDGPRRDRLRRVSRVARMVRDHDAALEGHPEGRLAARRAVSVQRSRLARAHPGGAPRPGRGGDHGARAARRARVRVPRRREGGRPSARRAPDLRRDRQRVSLGRRRRAGALRRGARPRDVRQGHGQRPAAGRGRGPAGADARVRGRLRVEHVRRRHAGARGVSRDARRVSPRAGHRASLAHGPPVPGGLHRARRAPRRARARARVSGPSEDRRRASLARAATTADEPVPPGDRGAGGHLPLRRLQHLVLALRGRRGPDARGVRGGAPHRRRRRWPTARSPSGFAASRTRKRSSAREHRAAARLRHRAEELLPRARPGGRRRAPARRSPSSAGTTGRSRGGARRPPSFPTGRPRFDRGVARRDPVPGPGRSPGAARRAPARRRDRARAASGPRALPLDRRPVHDQSRESVRGGRLSRVRSRPWLQPVLARSRGRLSRRGRRARRRRRGRDDREVRAGRHPGDGPGRGHRSRGGAAPARSAGESPRGRVPAVSDQEQSADVLAPSRLRAVESRAPRGGRRGDRQAPLLAAREARLDRPTPGRHRAALLRSERRRAHREVASQGSSAAPHRAACGSRVLRPVALPGDHPRAAERGVLVRALLQLGGVRGRLHGGAQPLPGARGGGHGPFPALDPRPVSRARGRQLSLPGRVVSHGAARGVRSARRRARSATSRSIRPRGRATCARSWASTTRRLPSARSISSRRRWAARDRAAASRWPSPCSARKSSTTSSPR